MGEIGGFLGWVTAIAFGLAILNFFVKYINKKYIINLSKEKPGLAKKYRIVMRYIVKYHRWAGIAATIAVILHFIVIYTTKDIISFTGVIAAVAMILIFLLGIFGTYIQKKVNGSWVKIHRGISFVLIAAIVVHLIMKV